MSPTIATRQPSSDGPRWRRSVNASSSACVGCSWRPSPALITTLAVDHAATRCGAPARRGARRSRRCPSPRSSARCRAGSRPSSPTTSRPRTSSCRRESRLRRGLEREAGAGRVFVEEGHDGLAPQRGHLRDVAPRAPRRTSPVRSSIDLDAGARLGRGPSTESSEVVDARAIAFTMLRPGAVPRARRRRRRRRPPRAGPARLRRDLVGRFLPTKSARTELPVAAVDEHRELHGPGPAELEQRVERGADGAAGEEDVVDEHDDLAGDVGAPRSARAGRPAAGRCRRGRRRRRACRPAPRRPRTTAIAAARRCASATPRV